MWPFKKKSAPSGRRDNRWTGGDVQLVLPPLPAEDVGAFGARFYTNEFQKHSGTETCLCIFEESEWARRYGSIKRIDLNVTSMAVRADGGPVAIALWNLLDAGKSLCHYEHYLDPLSEPTLQSLRTMEEQSRLKLVMRDNQSGETTGFWEFDNNFQMGDFASMLAAAFEGIEVSSFDERVEEAKRRYSTEQLIVMSERSLDEDEDEDEATDAGFAAGRTKVVDVEKVTRGEVSGSADREPAITETTPAESQDDDKTFSTKHAYSAAAREELDMPERPKVEKQSREPCIEAAAAYGKTKAGSDFIDTLVAELTNAPRSVTEWENDLLNFRNARLSNKLDNALRLQIKAKKSGDDAQEVVHYREAALLRKQSQDLSELILELAGTDAERFLQAHQAAINLDYPLERLALEFEAAYGREPNSKELEAMEKQVNDLKANVDKLNALLADEEAKSNDLEARLTEAHEKLVNKATKTDENTETSLLIDSVVQNSLENLGYKPDEASLAFLARHPFLAGRIWRMLGDGGAANMVGMPVSEESEESCELLVHYVRDESFRNRFPCAGALMQYAVYICDRSPEDRFGCRHPKDECVAAFAVGHAPTPPPAPKTQPTPAPKPEPVPSQSPNPKSSQTVTSIITSIVIPNSYKRDFDGIFAHLNQFGRWGSDKRKRFIIANWSWHTVVRIHAKGENIEVTASPRFRILVIFGFIPMAFIFAALNGGPGMGAVATATAFGIGWLFWWMFLLSNTLERMQKILVATNVELPVDLAGTVQSPATAKSHHVTSQRDDEIYRLTDADSRRPTDPNVKVAPGETPVADSTPDQSASIVQIRLVEDEPHDEESQRLDTEVELTSESSIKSDGGDGSDHVQANTKSPDGPTTDATNAHSELPQRDRVPAWNYVFGGVFLFGFGIVIGLAVGARPVNLREEYDRRFKSHLAGCKDDPVSVGFATFEFYSDVRLAPFDQKESADQIDFVELVKTLQGRPDAPKDDPPSSNNHATQNNVRKIAPHGTQRRSDDKPLVDGFTNLARSKMDQFEKDSNLQLHPDRAKRALAFGVYELGVEAARRADQRNVENSDQLWESAIESLNKAVELDPSFVAPRIVLACIHLHCKNEHDKAKQLLDEAIRREPSNAEAHYYLADVHYDDGNEEEAMRELNLAVNLDPYFGPAYRMRSRLYEARNELTEAALDLKLFEALAGNFDADYVYPWTLRSVLFRSKESGLTLQYSSAWYPLESMAEGSELRLIRHDHARAIAFSLIYLGEVFHPGMKREEMVVDLFEGMRETEPSVGNAEIVRLGVGKLIVDRQSVHWLDYEIKSPPLLARRSRIFTLEHAGKVWLIRFSTPRDEVLFRQYLPSAEDVILSISFQ